MTASDPARPSRRRRALAVGGAILLVLMSTSIMGGFVVSESRRSGWSVSGTIEATPDRVWRSLLDDSTWLSDEDRQAYARHDGPGPYVVRPPGARKAHTEVDGRRRSITTQGEWWYRGTLSVTPYESGSRVVYRVENVAPGVGWWAAQLVQGPQHAREMEGSLRETIDHIGRNLGVPVGPVEDHTRRTRGEKGA